MNEIKKYEHLLVTRPFPYVVHVQLNRPRQRNALNPKLWSEIGAIFEYLATDSECRAVVLSGCGPSFCAGIDLKSAGEVLTSVGVEGDLDVARKARYTRDSIKRLQRHFTLIEQCPKPVIAAIHGACVGGAIDMITAADIRFATKDAFFSIKEVDIGLAADVGTLNRLPKIVGNEGLVRELAYTARMFDANEALHLGLISRIFADETSVVEGGLALAKEIAGKSPVAVQGTKLLVNYARDHSVHDSLDYVATWNQSQLLTEDVAKSALNALSKNTKMPTYSKL